MNEQPHEDPFKGDSLFAFQINLPEEAPREFFPDSNWIGTQLFCLALSQRCRNQGVEVGSCTGVGGLNNGTFTLQCSEHRGGLQAIEELLRETSLASFALVGSLDKSTGTWRTVFPHPEFPYTPDFAAMARESAKAAQRAKAVFGLT